MRGCHNNPSFSGLDLNCLGLAICAILKRRRERRRRSSVADYWLDFFCGGELLSEKSKFSFSFDCTSLFFWNHNVLILIVDSFLAEYFLNFLKILTVIWRGKFIAQFPRNRGRGCHNLLRQLFYSCLTSGLITGVAVLISTLHTTQDRPHHKWLTMEDTVYSRSPVLWVRSINHNGWDFRINWNLWHNFFLKSWVQENVQGSTTHT